MINFANKQLPSFVKINSMNHSILPTVTHKTESVLGRAGAYDFGVDLGMRKLTMNIQIIGANDTDIMNKATELAEWLFYEDLQPLIIQDEIDKMYMARISGDTQLTEIYSTGQGTLEFVCPNSYKESTSLKTVSATPVDINSVIAVRNEGSAKTFPKVELTLKQNVSALSLVSNDEFILLGNSEASKTEVDANPLVLFDSLDSYTGWTAGISPDDGVSTGTFTSNGFSISQTGKNYGTGTKWHGATAIKSLSRELQDFEIQATIGHIANGVNQLGRIEVYALDSNNTIIGKMALNDPTATGDHARIEARAGSLTGGNMFAMSYGQKRGVWSKSNPAIIRLTRKGKIWSFYIGKQATDGSHNSRLYKEWIDVKSLHNKKVAKIMLHIGAFGTSPPVNNMYFSDLKVWDRSVTVNNDTQVEIAFKTGDIVTIDSSKAVVLLNGEPAYHLLNPSSSFFALNKGDNGLLLSPPVADVKVEYRERWL